MVLTLTVTFSGRRKRRIQFYTALLMSLYSTDKTFTVSSKLDLYGKSSGIVICMHLCLIVFAVPITLLFRHLPFSGAMD